MEKRKEFIMTGNNNSTEQGYSLFPWVLGGVLVVAWFAAILALAANGSLAMLPGEPPFATLMAIIGPPLLFVMALFAIPRLRQWALSLDPALLTAMQGWRVLGGGFLLVYAFGHLPGLFAWPASIGDVAVGTIAPFLAIALARGRISIMRFGFLSVHFAGLLDFVVAVGSGILTRGTGSGLGEGVTSAAMGQLPLVLIPTFVVPVFIILHLIVLAQVWQQRRVSRCSTAVMA